MFTFENLDAWQHAIEFANLIYNKTRSFPADEVIALASRRSQGSEVSFGDKTLKAKALEHHDFSDVDICLMSAGSTVSKEWSPKIAAAGAVVIDNSSCWRYDAEVPLIVPEVNAHALEEYMRRKTRRNIIANPNCSTAQLVVVTDPLNANIDWSTLQFTEVGFGANVITIPAGRGEPSV